MIGQSEVGIVKDKMAVPSLSQDAIVTWDCWLEGQGKHAAEQLAATVAAVLVYVVCGEW